MFLLVTSQSISQQRGVNNIRVFFKDQKRQRKEQVVVKPTQIFLLSSINALEKLVVYQFQELYSTVFGNDEVDFKHMQNTQSMRSTIEFGAFVPVHRR